MDIDQADFEEYESMKRDLENVDDLQTECDIDDDIAEWNEEPVQGTEFKTKTCEEVMEYDEVKIEEVVMDKTKTVTASANSADAKTTTQIVETTSVQAVAATSPPAGEHGLVWHFTSPKHRTSRTRR